MKVKINDKEFYMDDYLRTNLDTAKKVVGEDWDMVFIVDGHEGTGKSVLAQQVGYYLDPTLTIDRICFTSDEFTKAIVNASKFQTIIYDEAYGGLASRKALSEVNMTLISLLAEIRQKNLFVIIVLPCFFELEKYVAIWRSRALFHVYSKEFYRGYFEFYNIDKKMNLYIKGKKFYEYTGRPNFRGRFTSNYVIDEEAYRLRKKQSLKVTYDKKENKKETRFKNQRDKLINELVTKCEYKHQQVADIIDVERALISEIFEKQKDQVKE